MQKSGVVYGLLTLFISFLILLPLLWYGFGQDQGLFSYEIWLWREFHMLPYRDFFYNDFPGILLIHYAAQAIFGQSVTGFRAFDMFWQLLASLFIFIIVSSVFKNRLAGFLAAFFFCSSYLNLGQWDTGQRDGFLLLPYFAGFWLLARRDMEKNFIASAALAGLLIGFSILIRPVAAPLPVVFAIFIFMYSKSKVLHALTFCLACLAPTLLFFAYYWHIGALRQFYECFILYNSKVYMGIMFLNWKGALKGILLTHLLRANLIIWTGALILLVLKNRIPQDTRIYSQWLLLILLCIYMGYLAQGKYLNYHQSPVWGAMCIFGGAGWALFLDGVLKLSPHDLKIKTFAFMLALIIGSIGLLNQNTRLMVRQAFNVSPSQGQLMLNYESTCWQCAEYLKARTGPKDEIQIWGGETLINYLARRKTPSRFVYTIHLIVMSGPGTRDPIQKQFGDELLKEVRKNPPAYFLVETVPHQAFAIESDKAVLIRDYPEIWKFISDNYSFETNISYVEFYRRNK